MSSPGSPRRTLNRWGRWVLPVALAGVFAGSAAVGPLLTSANAAVSLPRVSPERLIARVLSARVAAFSGTVVESADLGLPALPAGDTGSGLSGLSALATGTHTLRLWVAPHALRLAVLGPASESGVVVSGRQVWTYSSGSHRVGHAVLPSRWSATQAGAGMAGPSSGSPASIAFLPLRGLTPTDLAERILTALSPSTVVTTGRDLRVAGQPAYALDLAPRATASLVREVSIDVDARNGLPLRVVIWARGQSAPALSVGFTSLSLARPAASVFDFALLPGDVVRPLARGQLADPRPIARRAATADPTAGPPARVVGSGWTAILDLPGALSPKLRAAVAVVSVAVPGSADRLIRTSLVTVLVTPTGVWAGAVTPTDLEAVAAAR